MYWSDAANLVRAAVVACLQAPGCRDRSQAGRGGFPLKAWVSNMVAIVSGNSLGLDLTSKGTLGGQGVLGSSGLGNSDEQVFVNVATGNLVVQRRDDVLASRGDDVESVRTYNSLGLLNDDNGDNWSQGVYAQQMVLSGTVSATGSTLARTGRDGAVAIYNWDASRGRYITRAGEGAHDTIAVTASQFIRTEGSTGIVEAYARTTGRLESLADASGNASTYVYDGTTGLLQKVVDASGDTTWYDYVGNQLRAIRTAVVQGGSTVEQTRVRYGYDSSGRLSTVTVDLSPAGSSTADGKVYTTAYTYDGSSKRVQTITQTDGSKLTFAYVQIGSDMRIQSVTDANNAVTSFAYDTVARRTTVTDALGKVWLYDYGVTLGQLMKITAPTVGSTNQTQSFGYDADGNVVTITNGDGEIITMTYDANGNMIFRRDAAGNTITRIYDQTSNQILSETVSTLAVPGLVNKGGVVVVGDSLVKKGGANNSWDSSFRTSEGLAGGASVGFTPALANKAFVVGLTTDPAGDHGYGTIDFALYCQANGELAALENGVSIALGVSYQANDALRVSYDGTKITYLKNGVVLRTVTVTIGQPLYVDTSFRDVGAEIKNLSFSQTATSGAVPLVIERGATVIAGSAIKTAGVVGGWDASVRSLAGYTGGAQVSFQPAQANKGIMVGLNTDPATNDGYATIDYALYCAGNGNLYIYESNVSVDIGQTYVAGDVLKIVYDGSRIKYFKNGVVLREVVASITQPLYLDSSFASIDGRIEALQFGATNLTPVNSIANGSGMAVLGDNVTRAGGAIAAWDAAVRSVKGYIGGANLSFKPAQTNKEMMVGLTTTPEAGYDYKTIGWAFYCKSDGSLEVWQGGLKVSLAQSWMYAVGDRLQVTYNGAAVTYLKNGQVVHTVAATVSEALYIDSSFFSQGGRITEIRFDDSVAPDLTTTYVYDSVNARQLRFVVSPSGEVTEYRYSATTGERISEIAYAADAYTGSGWTEAALETWVNNTASKTKTIRRDDTYDARGLVISRKEYESTSSTGEGVVATQRETRFIYDSAGQLIQKIEAAGSGSDEAGTPVTSYTYDGLGRLLTESDPRTGLLTVKTYNDSAGTVVTSWVGGATSTSAFDKVGRLVSTSRSGGGATTYSYDAVGRLLMTTDPTGVRLFRIYDEKGLQIAAVDGDGTLTETTYDAANRITGLRTYATAVPLSSLYDHATGKPLNPSLSSIRPTALVADLVNWRVYDDAGQLIYEVADSGAVTRYEYDGAGRLTRTRRYAATVVMSSTPSRTSIEAQLDTAAVIAAAGNDRITRYFHDGEGRVVGVLDPEGYLTTSIYDEAGRLVEVRRYDEAIDASRRADATLKSLGPLEGKTFATDLYFYDGRNQRIGHLDGERYLTTTSYNPRGLIQTQTRYATVVSGSYTPASSLSTIVATLRPSGVLATDRTTTYAYTKNDRVLSEINFEGLSTTYTYDDRGLLTKTVADTRTALARYDSLGRKTAELSAENAAYLVSRPTAEAESIWASRAIAYSYDDADRLISRTDANGNKTRYYYDLDGRLTHTVNARGEVEETRFNPLGQKVATIRYGTALSSAVLASLNGGFNAVLLPSLVANTAKDSVIRYAYDNSGRLSSITDQWIPDPATGVAGDSTDTLSYNTFDEVVARSTHLGTGVVRQDSMTYDRRGLLRGSTIDAVAGGLNLVTSSIYDAFGRVVKSIDARGLATEQTFDRLGRVLTITNAAGDRTATTFDAFGQALTTTQWADRMGGSAALTTTYSYNKLARSVTVTTPEGLTTTTRRTAFGQVLSVTDGNNVVTSYEYDREGNLTKTMVAGSTVEQRQYDAGGRLLITIDGRSTKTTYTYDAANRLLIRTVHPTDATVAGDELNLVTRWAYDAKGQAIEMIDPRQTVTRYDFDLGGRVISQTVNPGGLALTTKWVYDGDGRTVSVIDPRNVETRYTFDKAGRRTQEQIDPLGLNLIRRYTYDADNNVIAVTAVGTGGNDAITRYAYDAAGRLEYTVDAVGAVTKREYDDRGRLTRELAYANTVTAAQLPSAVTPNASLDRVTRYEYDKDGRLIRSASPTGAVVRSEYDRAGNVIRRTAYANTVASSAALASVVTNASDRIEQYRYDAFNRQIWYADAAGALTETRYDANGNALTVIAYATLAAGVDLQAMPAAATSVNDRVTDYRYDAANRKIYTVDALRYVTRYDYDAGGNVSSIRQYAGAVADRTQPAAVTADASNDRVEAFSYDAANRLTQRTDALSQVEIYGYDSAGNKITFRNKNGHVWTYTYDAAGRLLTETTPAVALHAVTRDSLTDTLTVGAAANSSVVTVFTYDSFGNLRTRTEASGRSEQRTTTYEYDKLNRQIKVIFPTAKVYAEALASLPTNALFGDAARIEQDITPFTQTWYDSFGDAVASIDRAGAVSRKAYDAAGRVRYEVDALGYITEYTRNAFGDATAQRRYATASTLANAVPTSTAPAPTAAQIDTVVAVPGFSTAGDRTLNIGYDKLGRAILVAEPSVHVYNSSTDKSTTYGARTVTSYNAFGEVNSVGKLADYDSSTAALTYTYTYSYYDAGGRLLAQADALGYLTTFSYDSSGNRISQREYSNAMAANSWNSGAYQLPTASTSLDRTTHWTWDALGRKKSETQVGVQSLSASTSTGVTTTVEDLTTTFSYDAVGNLIATQDATNGVTRSYYDALGRVSAVIASSRSSTDGGTALMPVTEFRRDAHGNVVAKLDRALSASSVTASSYSTSTSTDDRMTVTLFDSSGNARQTQDALGIQRYSSYTIDGKLGKNWQTVSDQAGGKVTLYAAYAYDKLGRLVQSHAPAPTAGQAISTDYQYNGFGELTGRGREGGSYEEYFLYDNAGRLWKTNTGDGYAKVYLYDLQGRQTAEISGAGSGRSASNDVASASSAALAAGWTSVRRVNTRYNALGHVLERAEAERQVKQGGVTLRKGGANASILASQTLDVRWDSYYSWSGGNKIKLAWPTLAYLGGGDVRVELVYVPKDGSSIEYIGDDIVSGEGPASFSLTKTSIYDGGGADTGVELEWTDVNGRNAGVSSISRLMVSKRDVSGNWIKVIDRDPSMGRPFGSYGSQIEIGSPVDPTTSVRFDYRLLGSTGPFTSVSAGLTQFGDSHWFDTSSLSGSYEYQVWFTEKDGAAELTESGTFVAGTDDGDDSAQLEAWDRAVTVYTRDRWGNALSQSDPRNATWLTSYTYNRDNQIIFEKRPDPSNGDQNANSPVRRVYFDKLGRQVAVQDERGFVNTQEWDAGGNLVREQHADGGIITHFYDAFGQRIKTVDALGNQAGSGTTIYQDHTTRYAYDRLGRLITTTHGDNPDGSVIDWKFDANWALSSVRKNLQETFAYDEAGRKISQTNGNNETTRYRYDAAGNLILTQKPGLQTTTAGFDVHGRKIRETDANGYAATWAYNYFGQLSGHTDIGGSSYGYTYDTAGLLTNQTNSRGQNLSYGYDGAGQLIRITDAGNNQPVQITTMAYDLAGRHLRERVERGGIVYQDNHLSYDTLGRLVDSADNRSRLSFSYDKAGNRTQVTTRAWVAAVGDADTTQAKDSSLHFAYDAMNRQTVVDGIDAAGNISSTQGHQLTYDLNGNRISDRFWGNKVNTSTPVYPTFSWSTGTVIYTTGSPTYSTAQDYITETYTYDALDRLNTARRGDFVVDMRQYDGAGRVAQAGPVNLPNGYATALNANLPADEKIGFEVNRYRYDVNGRLLHQKVYKPDATSLKREIIYTGIGRNSTVLGYDAVGNVLAYEMINRDGSDYTNTTTITTQRYEGYVESVTKIQSTKFKPGSSTSSYDANGYLVGVDDATENTLDRNIVNDAAGRALRVTQNGNKLYTHIVNGEILGKYGVGPNEVDPRSSKGKAQFQQVADFEFGYRSVSGSYPAPGVGSYTVRQGETLQSIAQAAWGDSSQWWRIAQANGLQGDRDLRVGQTLTLPAAVSGTSNNTGTFKPYNPADIIGDTSPNLPQPKKKGCGVFAQVLMVAVAVVVTMYTAGAYLAGGLSASLSAGVGSTIVSGATALAGGTIGAVGGALAAAAGAVASQALGIAAGVQEGFDWKGVALSAVSGGITAGLGDSIRIAKDATIVNAAVRAAVANAMTQGVGVVTGVQDRFSWTGVAAAAVGAGVGQAVGEALGLTPQGIKGMDPGELFGKRLATGLIAGTAAAAMRGGKVVVQQVAADAFGNAIGYSLVETIRDSSLPESIRNMSPQARQAAHSAISKGMDVSNPTHMAALQSTLEAQFQGRVLTDTERYDNTTVFLGARVRDAGERKLAMEALLDGGVLAEPPQQSPDSTANPDAVPLPRVTVTARSSDQAGVALGAKSVDRLAQNTGSFVKEVEATFQSKRWLGYALEGLSFAAAPLAFVGQKVLAETPLGEAIDSAKRRVNDAISDRFASVGYDDDASENGGVGVMTVSAMAMGVLPKQVLGFVTELRGIRVGHSFKLPDVQAKYPRVILPDSVKQQLGSAPAGMKNAHKHHNLEVNGRSGAHRALVREGQDILREYDIDPLHGVENLTWAPNKGHTLANAESLVSRLREARQWGEPREVIIEILRQAGEQARNR